ncbi:GMC family oxidoreductase N-terminal domain-containing protein [Actinoplanes sp. NPDC049596]|uniref:GMC family oxidoreductase n=1 Tax=unclassified Actinoplanes TaxID=2626549 RepID=UPI00343DD9F0
MDKPYSGYTVINDEIEGFTPEVIVVGGGSAGAAATRRLIDRGVKVLLLEAGAADVNPAIHDPGRLFELWNSPEDWAYHTVRQRHAAGRRLFWPRGRVLGGSSALNGMIWVRGAPADYDTWAYLGADGWSWNDVKPVFERIERRTPQDGGIVTIHSSYDLDPIHKAIVAAAQECGISFNPDYNGETQDGISAIQYSIADGVRNSVAAAYLHPISAHPNLRVVLHARARRLLLERGRCIGVEWIRDGRLESAFATEVVVSGGAIGSPQLLMLSGIGPAEHLRDQGINVVADLPGVGENLQDHLLSSVIFSAEREIGPPSRGLSASQTHLFWRSRPGLPVPDMQPIHFALPLYDENMTGPANGFTLMAGMIRPQSRGAIRLTGPSPEDELEIDPNVLACEADVESLVSAVELCRRIGAATPLKEWGAVERYPGPTAMSRDDLRRYVRETVVTYHHQSGTCKMGRDALSVVDPELRVHGVAGLRVADASIIPIVPTGNINAPSIMIGERVAEFISGPTLHP